MYVMDQYIFCHKMHVFRITPLRKTNTEIQQKISIVAEEMTCLNNALTWDLSCSISRAMVAFVRLNCSDSAFNCFISRTLCCFIAWTHSVKAHQSIIITHVSGSRGVGMVISCVCHFVRLSVCLHSKTKATWHQSWKTIITATITVTLSWECCRDSAQDTNHISEYRYDKP